MTTETTFDICRAAVLDELPAYDRPDPATITGETRLDALGIDSLDMISVVVTLESRFRIEINDHHLDAIQTMDDLVLAVQQGQAEGSPV